jgi:hypothetical protein
MSIRWWATGVIALLGCGGQDFTPTAPPTREQARDQVTTTFCDHASACGNVGTDKTYPTLDNCQVQTRAFMDGVWSAVKCDGKINVPSFQTCLNTVNAATCGDGLDSLEILDKCSADKVCAP